MTENGQIYYFLGVIFEQQLQIQNPRFDNASTPEINIKHTHNNP